MSRDYNIAWEVTGNCNHNCFYCYNYWRTDPSAADSCQGVDYARITERLLAIHPVSVALTGGEPLLVFDQIKSSITRFAEGGVFLRLLTNGTLVTPEIASFLAQHRVQLMVSFPTQDAERFAAITQRAHYDQVIRGLDLLKEHHCDVLINVVVSKVNLEDMCATADFLIRRYGFKTLYFSRATKPHNASDQLREQLLDNEALQTFFDTCLEIKKRYNIDVRTCGGYAYCAIRSQEALPLFAKGCGGGKSSFVISNSGDVRVCGKDSQVFGNLFTDQVDVIMDRAAFWTDDSAIPEACGQCQHRYRCRGGCHMSSRDAAPAYNSLDFNADPTNIPVIPVVRHFTFHNPFRRYRLNKAASFCHTENGNRFSCGFSFVYLSDPLTAALRGGKPITLFSVAGKSGCSFQRSKRLLRELLDKKIITEIGND